MKIRFEVTADDWLAAECHHWGRSPARRGRPGELVSAVLGAAGLVAAAGWVVGVWAALGLLVAVGGLVLRLRWMVGRCALLTDDQLREQYKESLPREAVGRHELELTADYLVERTPYSERRIPLGDVKEVGSVGDLSFISVEPGRGCVIPHLAVTEGGAEAFVAAVRTRVAEVPAEPGAAPDPAT